METNSSITNTNTNTKTASSFPQISNLGGERKKFGEATMFYSQCLLSRKGPFGAIWVAGYCLKRLKKRQVTDTHIPSSVDKILVEGLPSVTYRILAYLLLGVVRIYSKKVEYLFQDCHETICNLNKFSVGKKVVPFRDIVRSSHSISLPQRYELDTFRLEVADGPSRSNTAQNEDITLREDAGKDVYSQYSLDMHHIEEVPEWEELCNAQTSDGAAMQKETCPSTQTPEKTVADETSNMTHTPPDKVLSPHQMEIDMEEVTSPDRMKNVETSQQSLRELRFPQEECICEVDVELLNLINDYQKTDIRDGDAPENAPLENLDPVIPEDKEVPSVMVKAPPEVLNVTGVTNATQEFLAVPTPAKKENHQRPSKRKCIIDDILVLDNEVMKWTIKDASDLVCKRRKAPHTVIDVWRFSYKSTLSKKFAEPLIPCTALVELQHVLFGKIKKIEPSPSVAADKPVEIADEPVETTEAPSKLQDVVASPRTPATIAPGTPVRVPTSAGVFGRSRAADSDGEGPSHSYETLRHIPVHEEEDHGPTLTDQDTNEGDSQELHKSKNGLTARTRTVARYLHQVIQKKKQQKEEEAVTLLPILERRTKKENARLFFEVLVLTSGGFVNVMQEKAYDDVLLKETPKMEAILANC